MSTVESTGARHPGMRRMAARSPERVGSNGATRRVLNTGSGPPTPGRLHAAFGSGWSQVRLDIDANAQPDLVGSIRDMRAIVPDHTFDAIWASHNLEHLHTHEVPIALAEFRRVLKDDGFVLATSPDLEAVATELLEKGATAPVYTSPAGPIDALDMLYGHARSIAAGNNFMCHNTGFTVERLGQVALEAGFAEARVGKGSGFDLWGLFLMPRADLRAIALLLAQTPERFLSEDA